MLAKNERVCVYCRFRTQQLAFQTRRSRSRSSSSSKHSSSPFALTIRKHGFDRRHSPIGNHRPQASDFQTSLSFSLPKLRRELKKSPLLDVQDKDNGGPQGGRLRFDTLWADFQKTLNNQEVLADLAAAWKSRHLDGLEQRIRYHFHGYVVGSDFTEGETKNQSLLADLRYPAEWFPRTRQIQRKIHVHVGPTNSGKTYQALQCLEKAGKGIYAGPLRLLAHEVYTRMNAKGRRCSLLTGEERRGPQGKEEEVGDLASCTVEMIPVNIPVDVAVIDEIQMLGNQERGWAWTQALLGVRAKEVHLCGEARTVPLIKAICASLGEDIHIHHYERLTPLEVAPAPLHGNFNRLRKGDCVVSFSVMGIHALRKTIEKVTGKQVAVVYGSLPPETRAQQARLFNDPDNDYDYLVASDAVGMGLNLAIKRIIFETLSKFDGTSQRILNVADIKQIAGRAGRYRTAFQATQTSAAQQPAAIAKGDSPPAMDPTVGENDTTGYVTTLERLDFPLIQEAMNSEPAPLRTAGIFPPGVIVEKFGNYFPPGTPFSYIITRLHELSRLHPLYHLCGLKDQIWIADLIDPIAGLTLADRNTMVAMPASRTDIELWRGLVPAYARCIAEQKECKIFEIAELPLETLEKEPSVDRDYLRDLERLHKGLVAYLWLSYRFGGVFNTRALAFHVKTLVEEKIEMVLSSLSFSEAERRRRVAIRTEKMMRDFEEKGASEKKPDAGEADSSKDHEPLATEARDLEARARALRRAERESQSSLLAGGDHFGGETESLGLNEEVLGAAQDKAANFSTHQDALELQSDEIREIKLGDEDSTPKDSDAQSSETLRAEEQGRKTSPSPATKKRPSPTAEYLSFLDPKNAGKDLGSRP